MNASLVVLQGAALTVWFNILKRAVDENTTETLLTIIRDEDKANKELAGLCDSYFEELKQGGAPVSDLPGADTGSRVATAAAGIDAVGQQSQDIRSEVAATAAVVAPLIDLLTAYKILHDRVQVFQYDMGFSKLLVAARGMAADLEQVRVMQKFVSQSRRFCQQVAGYVDGLPDEPDLRGYDKGWVDDLKAATDKLDQAVTGRSPDAYDALYDLRTALRVVPPRLNQQIFVTAKRLPFGKLADGLHATVAKLPAGDQAVERIEAARDAILVLSSTTYARVVEHKLWQDVEHKLANLTELLEPFDGTPNQAQDKALPFQFSSLWRGVATKIRTLADLDPQGLWAKPLPEYSDEVSEQLTRETVDTELILAFETYRDQALDRFVDVDMSLKQECALLEPISDSLRAILKDGKP